MFISAAVASESERIPRRNSYEIRSSNSTFCSLLISTTHIPLCKDFLLPISWPSTRHTYCTLSLQYTLCLMQHNKCSQCTVHTWNVKMALIINFLSNTEKDIEKESSDLDIGFSRIQLGISNFKHQLSEPEENSNRMWHACTLIHTGKACNQEISKRWRHGWWEEEEVTLAVQ